MGFWASASSKVGAVRDWGMDQAVHATDWSTQKAKEGKDWAVARGVEARDWAVEKSEQAKDLAFNKKEQIKDVVREDVRTAVQGLAKISVASEDLLSSLDRRREFTSPTVSKCNVVGPPVDYDGHYFGKDCDNPTKSRPAPGGGHLPKGCENCGKHFPTITYTNGINTDSKKMCDTLDAIANQLCVEVIGVFNASFISATLPARSNAETMALLTSGFREGAKGAAIGGTVANLPGAAAGTLAGGAQGMGSTYLKQEVPRQRPETQDALDAVGTLKAESTQPATTILASDIAASLRAGEEVNLLGHSEGGINTVAAIAQAKGVLEDEATRRIKRENPALRGWIARAQAARETEQLMAQKMHVTLVGTQQTGLPPGPNYRRIAHKSDIIPAAISGAQAAIGREGYDAEPTSFGVAAPPVERFPKRAPGRRLIGPEAYSPGAAHDVITSYIPYMREIEGRAEDAPCC